MAISANYPSVTSSDRVLWARYRNPTTFQDEIVPIDATRTADGRYVLATEEKDTSIQAGYMAGNGGPYAVYPTNPTFEARLIGMVLSYAGSDPTLDATMNVSYNINASTAFRVYYGVIKGNHNHRVDLYVPLKGLKSRFGYPQINYQHNNVRGNVTFLYQEVLK